MTMFRVAHKLEKVEYKDARDGPRALQLHVRCGLQMAQVEILPPSTGARTFEIEIETETVKAGSA